MAGHGWSLAWRVYDAQYWGVPQRRKRIYLVADFGSERADEILFVEQGLRWDSETCGETREGIAADAERGAYGSCITFVERCGKDGGGKGLLTQRDVASTLQTNTTQKVGVRRASSLSVFDARGNGDGDTAPTMTGHHNANISDYTAVLVEKHE